MPFHKKTEDGKKQLEKEMPTLGSERARACYDLAFAEVISYKDNLGRMEQNENQQQNRQQAELSGRRKNCNHELRNI